MDMACKNCQEMKELLDAAVAIKIELERENKRLREMLARREDAQTRALETLAARIEVAVKKYTPGRHNDGAPPERDSTMMGMPAAGWETPCPQTHSVLAPPAPTVVKAVLDEPARLRARVPTLQPPRPENKNTPPGEMVQFPGGGRYTG